MRVIPLPTPVLQFIGFTMVLIGSSAMHEQAAPAPGEPALAWQQLALMVIAVGFAYLAGQLSEKEEQFRDEKPTTLATRGTFVPLVKGRRKIGYVFGWAGNRTKHSRVSAGGGGGKGVPGSKPREDAYNEDGWHQLCLGPVDILWEIDEGGVILLKGPITRGQFPSGSTISLGDRAGDFRIFWGEINQPINTWLGEAERVGVESSWPGLCYIEWRQKALGTQETWPFLTYTIETRPQENHLTHTPQVILSDKVALGPSYWGFSPIHDATDELVSPLPYEFVIRPDDMVPGASGGSPGAHIDLHGWFIIQYLPESQSDGEVHVEIVANSDPNSNNIRFICDESDQFGDVDIPVGDPGGPYTRFYLKAFQTLPATIDVTPPGTGRGMLWIDGFDGGWNGAHIMASVLFDPWPRGIALDQSKWDLPSLDALATIVGDTEDLRCAVLAKDGKTVREAIGQLMQDLGVTIALNPRTALLEFIAWRLPVAPLPNIPNEAIVRRPKKRIILGHRPSDRVVFTFSDESNNFRDMTIHVDDDGQATRKEFYNQTVTEILSTCNYETAAKISERRAAEELSKAHVFTIFANRAARALKPGEAVVVEGFDEVLRVTSVQFDPLSGEVELQLMNDFYGATLNDFIQPLGKTHGGGAPIGPDGLRAILVEIPEALTGAGGPQTVSLFALRSDAAPSGHYLYISRDNVTYVGKGFDSTIVAGGILTEDLVADSEWLIDQGPEFTAIGPDITDVLDLSADLTSWRNGRQLAVIGEEIFYLQKVTHVSGDTYRLDGLIRARYDTNPAAYLAANEPLVFIVQNDEGFPIQDVLLEPEVTLYGKTVPDDLTPADVPALSLDLYGKGVRPPPVKNVRLDLGADVVGSGTAGWTDYAYVVTGASPADDLVFVWSYYTPQSPATGAGEFPAGNVQLLPPPEGDFLVEILTSADVLVRTTSSATASYTYVRADRLADFSAAEPTSFKVRITQTRGGYLADPVTQSFSKV